MSLQIDYKILKLFYFSLVLILALLQESCFGYKNIVLLDSLPNVESVVKATFEAGKNQDTITLGKVLLTRKEHNELFWPHVGERFHSDLGMNADIAYDSMALETKVRFPSLAAYAKTPGKIQNIRCVRPVETYGPFLLHLGCRFEFVPNDPKLAPVTETVINGVIEANGQFKLYHLKD